MTSSTAVAERSTQVLDHLAQIQETLTEIQKWAAQLTDKDGDSNGERA